MRKAATILLRIVLRPLQRVRRTIWYFTRPRTSGAHALPITPEGKLVMVKLRYARGWRIPGGGRKDDEDPHEAVLREFREEIGMIAHGQLHEVGAFLERPDFKQDTNSIFIVRDVDYRPRWSFEVEQVREFALEELPSGTSPRTRRWIEAAKPALEKG